MSTLCGIKPICPTFSSFSLVAFAVLLFLAPGPFHSILNLGFQLCRFYVHVFFVTLHMQENLVLGFF